MSKVVTTEVNERRHRVLLNRHELKKIVADAVLKEIGVRRSGTVDVTIKFQDETEGSPAYRVGTQCIVDVVEDFLPQVEAREGN